MNSGVIFVTIKTCVLLSIEVVMKEQILSRHLAFLEINVCHIIGLGNVRIQMLKFALSKHVAFCKFFG